MQTLRDEGNGVTVESREFLKRNISKIGKVLMVDAWNNHAKENPYGEWNTRISGTEGEMFLSGFNVGYWGTGPNGLYEALKSLGCGWVSTKGEVIGNIGRPIIFHGDLTDTQHLRVDFQTNQTLKGEGRGA